MAKFGDKPTPTREERAEIASGMTFYELCAWRLVVRCGFSRDVAVEAVRRRFGVTVSWDELIPKARKFSERHIADSIT